jgi:hypothetical protein
MMTFAGIDFSTYSFQQSIATTLRVAFGPSGLRSLRFLSPSDFNRFNFTYHCGMFEDTAPPSRVRAVPGTCVYVPSSHHGRHARLGTGGWSVSV